MKTSRKGGGTDPPKGGVRVGTLGLALVDLNDTLIREDTANITATPAALREAVHRAGRAGWWVGLCSDSPYEPLQRWGVGHGIQPGAIIAENGGVVNGTSTTQFDWATAESHVQEWARSNGVRVFETRALAREFGGYVVDGAGIAFGEGRVCSTSVFCFDESGSCDSATTRRLGTHLRKIYGDSLDCDPSTGFLVVHASPNFRHMKGEVLQALGRTLGPGQKLVMIGNSVSDLITKPRTGESWMVANASHEARALADRTLERAHTEGVIEALNLLSRSR